MGTKRRMIACIIAYNEEELLPGCLESIASHVDEIVLVEGRIAEMPGELGTSSDRTIEIAQSFACHIKHNPHPWPDEQTMRNQYLIGNDGDWYFIIDADEMLLTPLPRPDQLPDVPAFRVSLTMLGGGHRFWPQRLFQHKGEMEYREIHDALYSDGVWVSDNRVTPILHSVHMLHRQPLRGRQRWADKRVKRQRCHERETPVRLKLYGE